MAEYKGKIVGEQENCCEENREVLEYIEINDDYDPILSVQCKVCGRKWIEVLD
jgi:hypothetical protein